MGPRDVGGLRQSWDEWLRQGADKGRIHIEITRDLQCDQFVQKGKTPKAATLPVGVNLVRSASGGSDSVNFEASKESADPNRYVWQSAEGWFSASYGPFRRFTGSDARMEKMFYSMPRLARHLSLFDERVALTESLEWLRTLKFRQMERDPEGQLFEGIVRFINQRDFLTAGVQLQEVTSRDIVFRDGNGFSVAVEQLSDGHRSILSMTFELIRQLAIAFGPDGVFDRSNPEVVVPPGVVLIDEIDAHLHPTWQRRIGRWLREHFPNMQFLVSTHSPLVCQSADEGVDFFASPSGNGCQQRNAPRDSTETATLRKCP